MSNPTNSINTCWSNLTIENNIIWIKLSFCKNWITYFKKWKIVKNINIVTIPLLWIPMGSDILLYPLLNKIMRDIEQICLPASAVEQHMRNIAVPGPENKWLIILTVIISIAIAANLIKKSMKKLMPNCRNLNGASPQFLDIPFIAGDGGSAISSCFGEREKENMSYFRYLIKNMFIIVICH